MISAQSHAPEGAVVIWQVRTGEPWGKAGAAWTDYGPECSNLLETALANDVDGITWQPGEAGRVEYAICLKTYIQKNTASGTPRPVRRLVITAENAQQNSEAERLAQEGEFPAYEEKAPEELMK